MRENNKFIVLNRNTARVKVQAPSEELCNKIVSVIFEKFPFSLGAPLFPSSEGGVHTFITVREEPE